MLIHKTVLKRYGNAAGPDPIHSSASLLRSNLGAVYFLVTDAGDMAGR